MRSKSSPDLSPSAQDYLEAMELETENRKNVRMSDIAKRMGVRLPSAVAMLKSLADKGLVRHEPYGLVELTANGRLVAKDVLSRHRAIFRFLNEFLGVDEATAEADACRIEHDLSPKTVKRLLKLVGLLESNPGVQASSLHAFPRLATGQRASRCSRRPGQ